MIADEHNEIELELLEDANMESEEADSSNDGHPQHIYADQDQTVPEENFRESLEGPLDQRVRRKLDFLLLPLLATLFLLNSIDKSNIGNAETAGFTQDAGLEPQDLNVSMGYFFAFFVALQPVGAALGRKFGMVRWVPACMTLWGFCTLLHIWVRQKWQLVLLRIAIACLESGFYPTTVAYLSLFYTRYEFAVRLSLFYGQTAVAGVIGGVLSWAIFSEYERDPTPVAEGTWKGWQTLFLIEGCLTMAVAMLGFFWLPKSADTAWFFSSREKKWAERRIILDMNRSRTLDESSTPNQKSDTPSTLDSSVLYSNEDDPEAEVEAHHRLLNETTPSRGDFSSASAGPVTADAGLSREDIYSAIFNYKIWHILVCNILSAIPATAFGVFLPLVMKQLSPSLNLEPSASNLLSAPPFAFGATMLLLFARWSDRSKSRLTPIFCGLTLLLAGLTSTLLVPTSSYVLRYISLCILLSGSFIASPLTVAWITNNTPEPGKRSILLGINGWGNLGGVFLSILFTPEDRANGYIRPFLITLFCALASFAGYVLFWLMVLRENKWREEVVSVWTKDEKEREDRSGDMPIPSTMTAQLQRKVVFDALVRRLGIEERRRGDEKMTFQYSL